MKTDVCKIMLADDHPVLLDALTTYINSMDNSKVIGIAKNGAELLSLITSEEMPNVVILDVNMPVMDGYETASILKIRYPNIKIIVFTMFDVELIVLRFLKIGVKGFIRKDADPGELKLALKTVIDDGFCYPNNVSGKLAFLFQKTTNGNLSVDKIVPTESEIEFLKLVTTEYTYTEIASIMNVLPRAVDAFRDSLFKKLDVRSRVGLAMYAVKNGLVEI